MNTSQSSQRNTRKSMTGIVISDSMDKTIVVRCERTYRHPLFKKVLRKTSKFYAHDEKNACKKGDFVKITLTRPLSKLKRYRLVEVLKQSDAGDV